LEMKTLLRMRLKRNLKKINRKANLIRKKKKMDFSNNCSEAIATKLSAKKRRSLPWPTLSLRRICLIHLIS
jgi:hypothetical protein